MNIGIIGAGYWGKNIIRNAINNNDISKIFIHDVNIKISSPYEKISDKIISVDCYETILRDQSIDSVFIITPPHTHYRLAKLALENDKHIFVEKPITPNSEELKELIYLANKNRKIIFSSHTYLHTPEVKAMRKAIKDEVNLGNPILYQSNRSNFGRLRKDVNVHWDLAIHDLYIIKSLFGKRPLSVSASGVKSHSGYNETFCQILIRYEEGFNASIVVNWLSPCKFRDTVIIGSKGSLFYDDCLSENKITIYKNEIPEKLETIDYNRPLLKEKIYLKKTEAIQNQINAFIKLIKKKDYKNDNAMFALDILILLESIDRSMENNGDFVPVGTMEVL